MGCNESQEGPAFQTLCQVDKERVEELQQCPDSKVCYSPEDGRRMRLPFLHSKFLLNRKEFQIWLVLQIKKLRPSTVDSKYVEFVLSSGQLDKRIVTLFEELF